MSSHHDGAAPWKSVVAERLEGVVAKRLDEPYRPGERRWINRNKRGGSGTPTSRQTRRAITESIPPPYPPSEHPAGGC
jgi:hypothetical protein